MVGTFAQQLRDHRIAAGLTQEALAEAARCSVSAIAALERGRRKRPRLSTARLLADALALRGEARSAFLAATDAPPDATVVDLRRPDRAYAFAGTGATPPDAVAGGGAGLGADAATGAAASLRPSSPLPRVLDPSGRVRLVGRGDELGRLEQAWRARRRLALVVGEAGVGKSRLVGELAALAMSDGATVLVGRCGLDRRAPFQPFVEVLRAAIDALPAPVLRRALGGHGDLIRLLPELGRRVGGLAVPVTADAATEKRLLFDAVCAVLAACGTALVVLDDLQWMDQSSLELLVHLAANASLAELTLVATSRPVEPGSAWGDAVVQLGAQCDLERIALERLGPSATAELVTELFDGRRAGDALLAAVHAATGGNAFFTEELVTHLLDSGQVVVLDGRPSLRHGGAIVGVPVRVRETLAGRLAPLSRPAAALLAAACVLGREFDPELAGRVADLGRAAVLDAVDEILATGLIIELDGGRLGFTHALVQTAVAEDLSQLRRAALHERVAALWEAATDSDAATVAHHFRQALSVDPALIERAATWAARAGEEAFRSAAFFEAISAFEEAVQLWAGSGRHTVESVDARLRLGEALSYVGRGAEADEQFRRGLVEAELLGDLARQARAAMGIGKLWHYGDVEPERVETIAAVLDRLDPADPRYRPTLASMLVSLLEFDVRPGVAARRAELSAIVRQATAPFQTPGRGAASELAGLLSSARPYLAIDDPVALAGTADAMIDRGRTTADLMMQANGYFCRAWAALSVADRVALQTSVERYDAVAQRLGLPEEQAFVANIRGGIAQIEGRYDDLAGISQRVFELNELAGSQNAFVMFAGQTLLRALDIGDAAAILPEARHLAVERPVLSCVEASIALCAVLADEVDLAKERLDRYASAGFDRVPRDANWHASIASLAHAATLLGARRHALPLAELLATSQAAAVRVGPMSGWWGPVDHHVGALLCLAGRPEAALPHLERAARLNAALGAVPFAARTKAARARCLLARDHHGDRAVARRLVAAAQHDAETIGARGIVAELRALREQLT